MQPQSFGFDANDRLNSDSYDANGNTLFGQGFGQSQADRYDSENRLVQRVATLNSQPSTLSYTYDGDGNRVSKTVTMATNTVTTYYVVDDLNPTGYSQVLEEHVSFNLQPATLNLVYTYGHTLISHDRLEGTIWRTSFYGFDGHSNVRHLTDIDGRVTDTYDYDAYGNLISRAGTTPNNYLFSGEQFDPDLGLYYLRARYHNPDTGRFWTQDSYEGTGSDPSSLHKYTYCANNPVNAWDPSGNFTITETMAAQKIGFGQRLALASLLGGIGGAINAIDTAIGKNYDVTAGELGKSFGIGFGVGFTLGFGGTYAPNAVAVIGAGLGGIGVGSALNSAITEGGAGNWSQLLFRSGTLGLGLAVTKSVTSRELTYAYEKVITQGEARLFPNLKPGDVEPATFTHPTQIKAGRLSGTFTFVVLRGGILRLGAQRVAGPRNGHADLAFGKPIRAAGEITFKDGEVVVFTDRSGHYNRGLSASDIQAQITEAIDAFAGWGIQAEGKFQSLFHPNTKFSQ